MPSENGSCRKFRLGAQITSDLHNLLSKVSIFETTVDQDVTIVCRAFICYKSQ